MGRVIEAKEYKNDELHGEFAQWYSNGVRKESKRYSYGILNGWKKEWNIKGEMIVKTLYVNGLEEQSVDMKFFSHVDVPEYNPKEWEYKEKSLLTRSDIMITRDKSGNVLTESEMKDGKYHGYS